MAASIGSWAGAGGAVGSAPLHKGEHARCPEPPREGWRGQRRGAVCGEMEAPQPTRAAPQEKSTPGQETCSEGLRGLSRTPHIDSPHKALLSWAQEVSAGKAAVLQGSIPAGSSY